jgi:hypothetical protein
MTCYNTLMIDRYTDNRDEREPEPEDMNSPERQQLRRILGVWVVFHGRDSIIPDLREMFGWNILLTTEDTRATNRYFAALITPTEGELDPWWIWGHKDTLQRWGLDTILQELQSFGLHLRKQHPDPLMRPMPGEDF